MKTLRHALAAGLLLVSLVSLFPVPSSAATYSFGSSPKTDAINAAEWALNKWGVTDINKYQLAAMLMAVTWPETQKTGTNAPSPMTEGRGDNEPGLYESGTTSTTYKRAFFHAGIGMWQIDGGGLGLGHTAAAALDTSTASKIAADEMARLWANYHTRTDAWTPWHACDPWYDENQQRTRYLCEEAYTAIVGSSDVNVSVVPMSSLGGAVWKQCYYWWESNITWDCLYADPAQAQGYKEQVSGSWQQTPFTGDLSINLSPLAFPYYVYSDSSSYDVRIWRKDLTGQKGYSVRINATRYKYSNPRSNTSWDRYEDVCTTDGC